MSRADARSDLNPIFVRHDLMIEAGRLEEAIGTDRSHRQPVDPRLVPLLEAQFASAREALLRLLL